MGTVVVKSKSQCSPSCTVRPLLASTPRPLARTPRPVSTSTSPLTPTTRPTTPLPTTTGCALATTGTTSTTALKQFASVLLPVSSAYVFGLGGVNHFYTK